MPNSFSRMALGKYLQNLQPIPYIQHWILSENGGKSDINTSIWDLFTFIIFSYTCSSL